MENPMNKFALAIGNPFDGVRLIGPFETHDEAVRFSEDYGTDCDWWIVEITAPEM